MQTNPEQWALDLWKAACFDAGGWGDREAALTIQAAFAEREARLVQALESVEAAMIRGGDGRILDTGWNITKLNEARPLILAALKAKAGS